MFQRQVSFGEAVNLAFNNYCCFTGRASRSEYWWFQLFQFIVAFCVGFVSELVGIGNWLSGLVSLVFFLPGLGLCWRRLHDIGRAGGWYFIGLIPVVGWIMLIVWLATESEMQPNRFGDVPNMESR